MAPIAMRAVPARPVVAPFRRKLRHGGKGRADAFRQRLLGKPDLRQLFDVAQIGAFVIGAEAERDPFRSRTRGPADAVDILLGRSEEHTSELQSLMRISYAVFCLKKKNNTTMHAITINDTH